MAQRVDVDEIVKIVKEKCPFDLGSVKGRIVVEVEGEFGDIIDVWEKDDGLYWRFNKDGVYYKMVDMKDLSLREK